MSLGTKKQERDRKYYLKHKEAIQEKNKQWKKDHPLFMSNYLRRYYQDNKATLDIVNKEWYKRNPEAIYMHKLKNKTKHRERYLQLKRDRMKQNRLLLFDILGGRVCIKCGYSEDTRALTFDHLRDDGRKDRKMHSSSYGFYRFHVKNPDIAKANLQVLCSNCNAIKRYDLMGFKILKEIKEKKVGNGFNGEKASLPWKTPALTFSL